MFLVRLQGIVKRKLFILEPDNLHFSQKLGFSFVGS